jgi:hypothetical protein
VRENEHPSAHVENALVTVAAGSAGTPAIPLAGRWQSLVGTFVAVDRKSELVQVVAALASGRGFADLLDCRKEQPNENGDNRNHDEKLDQCERDGPLPSTGIHGHTLNEFHCPGKSEERVGRQDYLNRLKDFDASRKIRRLN